MGELYQGRRDRVNDPLKPADFRDLFRYDGLAVSEEQQTTENCEDSVAFEVTTWKVFKSLLILPSFLFNGRSQSLPSHQKEIGKALRK